MRASGVLAASAMVCGSMLRSAATPGGTGNLLISVRRELDNLPVLQRPPQDGRTAAIRAGSAVKHRRPAVDRDRGLRTNRRCRVETGRPEGISRLVRVPESRGGD